MSGVVTETGRGARCSVNRRYGIEATRMPRMAASQALHRQPATTQKTEALNGLEGIVGTGRMEPASGTEQWADGPLIYPDQQRGQEAHCSLTFFHIETRLACNSGRAAV